MSKCQPNTAKDLPRKPYVIVQTRSNLVLLLSLENFDYHEPLNTHKKKHKLQIIVNVPVVFAIVTATTVQSVNKSVTVRDRDTLQGHDYEVAGFFKFSSHSSQSVNYHTCRE